MAVSTSVDGVSWTPHGTPRTFPADSAGFSAATVAGNGAAADARFVRYALTPGAPATWIMVDEVSVDGTVTDTRKFVPGTGCYHGAFPTDPTGYGYLYISSFESLAQKALRMVLWYADWAGSFQSQVGYVIDSHLGGRYLEAGVPALQHHKRADRLGQPRRIPQAVVCGRARQELPDLVPPDERDERDVDLRQLYRGAEVRGRPADLPLGVAAHVQHCRAGGRHG